MGYGFGFNKHRLLWLLNHYHITMISLAQKANVPVSTVQSMAWTLSVQKESAEQVLAALSSMVRVSYTLENVDITLYEQVGEESCHTTMTKER